MKEVDFGYVGDSGCTIYRACFDKYLTARETKLSSDRLVSLIMKTEEIFFFLVEQGNKNGYNVDAILEIPDNTGNACFPVASQCSFNICNYIIARNIKVNSITTYMMVPSFKSSKLTIQMLKKGINPYVINFDGVDVIHYNPSSFENEEAKRLLAEMPRSVHYSIEDIDCEESCPADCTSEFKRFYYKNGPLVEMTEDNRIGKGGFGWVYRQIFHGKPMAMKCIPLGELIDLENQDTFVQTAVDYLERNIFELRIQSAIVGPGVIVPVAYVRQQDQEQDENGEWIALNYDIYIYPLYDINLYQLHENFHDQFSDEILLNILHQCLTRKGSISRKTAFNQ